MRTMRTEPAAAIVWLDDRAAADATVAGAKAASLARARAGRLPALAGFVLTTRATAPCRTGEPRLLPGLEPELHDAWVQLSANGQRRLVVRSSSTNEDGSDSSMAGQFTSVLGVASWDAFLGAVDEVLSSSQLITLGDQPQAQRAPMAVLVQPMIDAACGGVLFGADPITGDRRRLVVAAVQGGPERLVHGDVQGSHHTLTTRGRLLATVPGSGGAPLGRRLRLRLARLAARTATLAGGPQDVEWAATADGHLWLLQSRPITALPPRAGGGPVLGPGPVAETFPDPLSPLEEDLWVGPLAAGVRNAVALTGAVSSARLARSPIVTTVRGLAVADLELLGAWHGPRRIRQALDPRPPARRLAAAWRMGRLRAALPGLARDLCREIDQRLLEVPAVEQLSDAQLIELLHRSRDALTSVHTHEVLLGLQLDAKVASITAASLAHDVLTEQRAAGRLDADIVAAYPVVLALTAPAVGPPALLPQTTDRPLARAVAVGVAVHPDERAVLREALRLRARWLHELTARAAWQLGIRLHGLDLLADPAVVRLLRLDELVSLVQCGITPGDLDGREEPAGTTVPSTFRLSPEGIPVAVASAAASAGAGRSASGGRATGVVHGGPSLPEAGAVLVVQSLDPRLAPLLPRLGALVAETGSPLSHLAILAREIGLPVVVGVPGAVERFTAGAIVEVDGDAGTVHACSTDHSEVAT